MRHRKRSRRLVGKWEHRKALMRNLLVALFVHERIRTTEAKAKELRRWADKMITLAKRGDLNARRQALSILPDKAVVRKLFSDIRERYLDRDSGFTRIVRIGPRRGDAAMMVFIELVTDKLEHKRSPKKIREDAEAASGPADAAGGRSRSGGGHGGRSRGPGKRRDAATRSRGGRSGICCGRSPCGSGSGSRGSFRTVGGLGHRTRGQSRRGGGSNLWGRKCGRTPRVRESGRRREKVIKIGPAPCRAFCF